MPNHDDLTAEEREHQPLVQQLQEMYNTRIQDEYDLGAIRQQLSQTNLLAVASGTKGKTSYRTPGEENLGRIVHPSGFPSHHKTSWSRPLSILAALLMVALLTGSFVLLARSRQSAPTRPSNATSPPLVSTPCHQSYLLAGTILRANLNQRNANILVKFGPHDGDAFFDKGPQRWRDVLGETFVVTIGPDTHLFEQQKNGCHAASLASIRVGLRIQISQPKGILQSYPSILGGVEKLILLPPNN